MKFSITIDKNKEAVIDRKICINCGECRDFCPTGAIDEYQKTAVRIGHHGNGGADSFADAKKQSLQMACSVGCPLGIVPQTVAAFIEKGESEKAARHIRERNPLPGVCAAVCEHLCQETCKRQVFEDAPLNMKALEGFALANTEMKPFKYIKKHREKVAVIGGGPAGLGAAFALAKAGYSVTVFEKDFQLGGAMRWGIPEFRLNKALLRKEIDNIVSAGIDVKYGWYIGENHSLEELWSDGYSACLIAVGMSNGVMPEIKGAEGEGVYDGVTVMRQVTGGEDEGIVLGDKVVVVGSSGFAADLARVLRRMDKNVVCVMEEREEDINVPEDVLDLLIEEGVELRTGTKAQQVIIEDGKVKALELFKGNAVNYFCDSVIFAGGQKCFVENICKAETYPNGMIRIDEDYSTNKNMIFACGDATGETSSVVEALAAGMEAAAQIDRALQKTAPLENPHELRNAPDGMTLYPESIVCRTPQAEKKTREGEAVGYRPEPAEDVTAVLRAAGIEDEMPRLEAAEGASSVAVVGGGIAGITAAIALMRRGHKVTIFEKEPELGGNYRWLATDKRIDREFLKEQLKKVRTCGIDVICNVTAGVRPDIGQLLSLGYDAVLFAVGEYGGGRPVFGGMKEYGILDMVPLMRKLADHQVVPAIGRRVLVAGGDELTVDIARRLKEFCEDVTIATPWSKGGLQAKTGAVTAALDEGVNLITGVEVVDTEQKGGKVYTAICKVTEKGHTINVPCDTLVMGGGGPATQTVAIRNLELDMDNEGYIAVDHKMESSIRGVFAIGNLNMSATDAGRAGAIAVDNYLTGKDEYIGISDDEKPLMSTTHELIEGRKDKNAPGFETGKLILDNKEADIEASRCMKCGYHNLKADMCMGCGICVKVCPVNAVVLKEV